MKIAINLLPAEMAVQRIKAAKFYKIQTVGVAVILIMIFLASLTIALRILQSHTISQIQDNLTKSQQKISDLKNTQASLFLLKNRLNAIDQYLGVPSVQSEMYKIISQLIPSSVSINSISINKGGEVLVLALIPDGNSLDELVTNLTLKENNQDKISQVSLENINRGKDGIYRLSLKIKPK